MIRWFAWCLTAVALALAAVPVGSDATGGAASCGPAATSLVGLTEPPDPRSFVPERPGADFGVSRQIECTGLAFPRVMWATGLAILAVVLGVVSWRRRRRVREAGSVTSPPEPGAMPTS